ncbi:hypothetical protein E4P42_22875 [Mycobacterium sp. PS03-16]|uniref:hypothetical protein n=1 Tax=Mycobacterium sp. PS03-16 TaxID=2559611 RepID=UPI0010735D32|nr:hypothetical protein [Mycobacterium sp. PS03-16]TFV55370.1 hypothetical protein E4P42_22875 [Mycobacterium sp. PS03-16]
MSPVKRGYAAGAAAAVMIGASQLSPAVAVAEPVDPPQPVIQEPAGPVVLHNIVYRARIDGVSRGATISYAAEGDQTQTANPTMVPGRVFEANTVLPESGVANMRVAIEWPYSANLHCEILVDDQVVAQADDFIAPRVLPQRDDPDYGAIVCEAPVSGVQNMLPADAAAPPPDSNAPPLP